MSTGVCVKYKLAVALAVLAGAGLIVLPVVADEGNSLTMEEMDVESEFIPGDIGQQSAAAVTSLISVDGAPVLTAHMTPQGAVVSVPTSAFRSRGVTPTGAIYSFLKSNWSGAADGGMGCIMAPVYLPNGATVTKLYAYYIDNDAGLESNIVLRRSLNLLDGSGSATSLASVITSGSSTDWQELVETSIENAVVDNLRYDYSLTTCLESVDISFYGARIYYTVD